ncbi:hypothetical protein [Castellaniella defragrans]|uniref:Uncharacterized protein n=1 Tax=Castellaniella defragrans TaxID=75697 RepID=A0A7W9TM77_CASDE|nr:hypothetical protein [Castellaniella defragrans]MBB6082946.1 hypothetical protein [Castellaniella defragrans]
MTQLSWYGQTSTGQYRLTFSDGPRGQHHMDVCGEGDAIERSHLARLASESGVPEKIAGTVIDGMLEHASTFIQRAEKFPIRRATRQMMSRALERSRQRLVKGR